jgi:hypothetical protein
MDFGKILLSVLAAVAISSAAAAAGLAPFHARPQGIDDPGGTVRTSNAVFQRADVATTLPTGFASYQVGSTMHLHCGASAGCVVFVQSTMEIDSTASDDGWFICAQVDKQATNPIECASGTTNSSAQITEGVYNGTLQVGKGSHTVKFYVETLNAAQLYQWHETAQMMQ